MAAMARLFPRPRAGRDSVQVSVTFRVCANSPVAEFPECTNLFGPADLTRT
jgi:hypothetical protein